MINILIRDCCLYNHNCSEGDFAFFMCLCLTVYKVFVEEYFLVLVLLGGNGFPLALLCSSDPRAHSAVTTHLRELTHLSDEAQTSVHVLHS